MTPRPLTQNLEGYVSLSVRGEAGDVVLEAIVDTGFNGYLSLSPGQVADLDLKWSRYETAELADGEEFLADLFEAEVECNGRWRTIEVAALGSTPLLGMQLLRDHRLTIDVVEGGLVSIEPLGAAP